jgi:acyl-CoA synthetase (NDP forming)
METLSLISGIVQEILSKAVLAGRHTLLDPEAASICSYSGITVPELRVATTVNDACTISQELGFPLVLKIISPEIIHKTEAGAVQVNIQDREQLKKGFEKTLASARAHVPNATITGVLIQRMARKGVEVIVGGFRDPQFGPTVLFGLGGVFVEIFKDVVFRLAPVDESEAYSMVRSLQAYPILCGYRDMPRADESALVDILLKTSRLMSEHPEIDQIDLNPIISSEKETIAVDARILLADRHAVRPLRS